MRSGSNSVVLGSLQKGDYTLADFGLIPDSYGESLPLKFQIAYTSSDGERELQDKELSVYASRPDASQSAVKSNSSGGVNNLLLLTLALLGGAGFVLYKKKKL